MQDNGAAQPGWEQEAQCSVCLELLDEPVMLDCGHNVCLRCAEQLHHAAGGPPALRCPECRQPTAVPAEGVGALRRNLGLRNLVQRLQAERRDTAAMAAQAHEDHPHPYGLNAPHAYHPPLFTAHHPRRAPPQGPPPEPGHPVVAAAGPQLTAHPTAEEHEGAPLKALVRSAAQQQQLRPPFPLPPVGWMPQFPMSFPQPLYHHDPHHHRHQHQHQHHRHQQPPAYPPHAHVAPVLPPAPQPAVQPAAAVAARPLETGGAPPHLNGNWRGFVPDSISNEEAVLVRLTIDFLESPVNNPNRGSVSAESVHNTIKSTHPDLYQTVVGTRHNAWRRFIERHPEVFEMFQQEAGKWRIRLLLHTNWAEADRQRQRQRQAHDGHVLQCLLAYLRRQPAQSCKVDEFIEAYPAMPGNQDPDAVALPKRRDLVGFVRKHAECLGYDGDEKVISLK